MTSASLWVLLGGATANAQAVKQSNAGDSISQAAQVNSFIGEHPQYSWVRGTDKGVDSIFLRYQALNPNYLQEPESVSGAELVGGSDNFAGQAARICNQQLKPDRVDVLLGGNDVCSRAKSTTADATANLYSVTTWVNALDAGLDQLAQCLPQGAIVHVVAMPRVDFLYEAGHAKSFWCGDIIWPVAHVCRVVTGEKDVSRRRQVGARINQYNDASLAETLAYDGNTNGKNPNHVRFASDYRGSLEDGNAQSSVGAYQFSASEINALDCFHPDIAGQKRIACAVWASTPEGANTNIADCFTSN